MVLYKRLVEHDMHQTTHNTYNQSAGSLSQHYDEIGSRDGDIDLAFTLAGNPTNAAVLELGCGNGRDAREIIRRTPNYLGVDSSEKMIEIAKSKVPKGTFITADVLNYEFLGPYDIVFAFALLRHISLVELPAFLKQVGESLKPGGVLYISSPHSDSYHHVSLNDRYGTREMHYYNPAIIQKYCPASLKKAQEIYDAVNGVEWFELALKKI